MTMAVQKARPDLTELGSTGLRRSGGHVTEEFLRELSGKAGIRVYGEMAANDPVVGAILFAIDMLIRQMTWRVEPASQDRVDEEAAEFLRGCLEDMSTSWPDTVSEILSMLVFGWAFHEVVYKVRQGDSRDPSKRSRFQDGRIGWRKLPIRSQDSLVRWEFDEQGGIQAMLQQAAPDYQLRTIPIEKGLLFRTQAHKGNPEGRSILRSAYRSWFFKRRIEEIEAIGVERDLAGLPVAKVPPEWLMPGAPPDLRTLLEETKRIITGIRRDEQEGLIEPAIYDEHGHALFEFRLLTTGGRRSLDTDEIVARYDQRIAMSVLADFILLGHEKVGSQALGVSKTEMFSTALGAFTAGIAGVFNRHAIPRLFALNGFQVKALPRLEPGEVEAVDLKELGEFIRSLAGAGMPLFPDEVLEAHLRQRAKLPAPPAA